MEPLWSSTGRAWADQTSPEYQFATAHKSQRRSQAPELSGIHEGHPVTQDKQRAWGAQGMSVPKAWGD